MVAEGKRNKTKNILGTQSKARAGWLKRLRPVQAHPKTLFEIPVAVSTNRGSFPSNSNVSATFSISINSGKFWNLGHI